MGGKVKRSFLKLAVLVTFAWAITTTASAADINLRYAHVGSEGDIQYWYADEFAKRVPKWTEDRLTFKVFPNSQMGGVQELIDGVKSGSLSMGHHQFSSLSRLVENIAVFDGPFVYRDGDHAMLASSPGSPVLKEFNEQLIKEGNMRIIGTLFRGARQMTCKFPVYEPKDLEGKPFRGVPIPLWTTMVKGMGAIPTPVEVSELPTALMTGMVVGQENPLTMINANKLYEVQSYVMLTGHMQNVLPIFINEDEWQKISEADREAILKGAAALGQETLEMAKKAEKDLIGVLTEKGMTFITEKDGLRNDLFREGVLKQVKIDFPDWPPYYEKISKVGM
jgi:TRAP-type C4-dicarboxylate transport system substrate-binding protein